MSLLQKIGECIAQSICHIDSGTYFRDILMRVQRDAEKYSPITIKVYLLIILKVIKDKKFLNQKSKPTKIADVYNKSFSPEHLSNLMI